MTAPETLLAALLGGGPEAEAIVHSVPMLMAPYDALASASGWVVDLSNPEADNAPFTFGLETARDRALAALAIALDYAVRRGATSLESARVILAREGPVWVKRGDLPAGDDRILEAAERLGFVSDQEPAAFGRRRRGHEIEVGRRHDPALSFQAHRADRWIGGNSLSSFLVHDEPESDGVEVTGEIGPRWGVEIGIAGPGVTPRTTAEMEECVWSMPAFLDGVSTRRDPHSLVAGWRQDDPVKTGQLAHVLYAWTKALFDLDTVQVRAVFAVPGEAEALVAMRERAAQYRAKRSAASRT
jgi:hypothetical protein